MESINGLPVLLVIDMLNDFVNPKGVLYNKLYTPLIPKIVEKINHFNKNGFPIVYIGDAHSDNDVEFGLYPKHCTTQWGQSFVPEIDNLIEISPKGEEKLSYVLSKNYFSPFVGNEFGEYNTEIFFDVLKPSEIHVTGIMSNICVLYTVSDLVQFGFKNIYVHENCTASYNEELHRFAMKQMNQVLKVNVIYGNNRPYRIQSTTPPSIGWSL